MLILIFNSSYLYFSFQESFLLCISSITSFQSISSFVFFLLFARFFSVFMSIGIGILSCFSTYIFQFSNKYIKFNFIWRNMEIIFYLSMNSAIPLEKMVLYFYPFYLIIDNQEESFPTLSSVKYTKKFIITKIMSYFCKNTVVISFCILHLNFW